MTTSGIAVKPARIRAIDLLRGWAMIFMAVDHVRDFWGPTPFDALTVSGPDMDVRWYFTRWITHFCAPIFVFLAGTSAFLYRQAAQVSKPELSRFLFTRGLWLVFVELVIVNISWQFAYNFVLLQVIWALGLSMLLMALLIYLPMGLLALLGLLMVAGHNALDTIRAEQFGDWAWLWSILHQTGMHELLGQRVAVRYPVIPWVGVMALGYVFGQVMTLPQARRDRLMIGLGILLIALFVLLRWLNFYGDPRPLREGLTGLSAVLDFLRVHKYPPSLLFLLMTLGPSLILLAVLERWHGKFAEIVGMFGRVPFFFYILHLPLINFTAGLWNNALYGSHNWWMAWEPLPDLYQPNIYLVWAVWLATLWVLYYPCRWFANYKRTHKYWWLSYL